MRNFMFRASLETKLSGKHGKEVRKPPHASEIGPTFRSLDHVMGL
jgi:hypothetical protein